MSEKERKKYRAIVYDVVPSGSESRMRELVEKTFDEYVVVKEYVEKEGVVEMYGRMPVLSEMLTDIIKDKVHADVVIIKNTKSLRGSDKLLFVKRILELKNMKLLSLSSRDNKLLKLSTRDLLNRVLYAKIYDIVGYFILISSTLIMWILFRNLVFTLLFLGVAIVVSIFHYRRGLKARRYTEKLLRRLLEMKLPRDTRRIKVRISEFGAEILEDREK